MSPTSLLALALMSGVLLGETLRPPAAPLAALAFLWLGVVAVAWRRGRGWGLATLGQVVLLGALATVTSWPRAPDGLLGGPPWVVTARVLEPPMEGADDAHVLLGLEEVARDGQAQEAAGRLWLRLGGAPKEPLLPGDRVLFRAQLRAPRGFAEPDAPDPARHFAARGLVAVAGLPAPEALVRLAGQERWCLGRPVARLRQRWLAWLRAELPSKGEAAGLMASLLLGERGAVSRSLERDFRVAGVSHVLSVSGLHLAIASFLLFIGLRRLLVWIEPLARRVAVRQVAALAALPAVVLYTLLTGAQVATVRACIVALLYLAGAALLRPAAAGSALAVAVLAILGASPLTLFDPSFQLSFAAALGGIVVAPRLPGRGFPSAGTGLGPRIVRGAFALVRVSLAALVTTAPITAWHFAQLGPAGLWANVLVVPLAELWVLPLGLGACVLGALPGGFGLFGALAHMLLALAAGGATFMIRAVRAIASVPGLAELGHVPPPTLLECAAWYGGLLALTLAGRRAWRVALLCGLVLGGSLAWRLVLAPRWDPALTVTFLDVGQGDAALVELPGGVTLLVDGGGSFDPSFDPGAQVLVPWLERHGVRRLDAVVLTHPHPDHANGLAAVVARFPTREVWTNGARSSLPGLLRLRDAAAERGVPIVRPHELVAGAARVEVLHPLVDGQVRVPPAWSENDGSIVLRILYGGRAVLLAGDIEARAEARLAQSGRALAADVLKAPHHGSRTSSTPRFVERVRPSVVVYSVGDQNRWGFPAPAVDARWRAAGARTYRTDRDGAVTVRIDTRGRISVRTARAFR